MLKTLRTCDFRPLLWFISYAEIYLAVIPSSDIIDELKRIRAIPFSLLGPQLRVEAVQEPVPGEFDEIQQSVDVFAENLVLVMRREMKPLFILGLRISGPLSELLPPRLVAAIVDRTEPLMLDIFDNPHPDPASMIVTLIVTLSLSR